MTCYLVIPVECTVVIKVRILFLAFPADFGFLNPIFRAAIFLFLHVSR